MDDYLARAAATFSAPRRRPSSRCGPGPQRQARGEAVVWCTFEGFFWFTRTLMGFERLMYAYYDQPELIHRINRDLLEFNLRPAGEAVAACACPPS